MPVITFAFSTPSATAKFSPVISSAEFADYERITGVPGSGAKARASLRLLLASGVSYQLRTTVHPTLLDNAAVMRLSAELAALGDINHVIQPFRRAGCADETLNRELAH